MKENIKKALCIVAAFATFVTMYGCKEKDSSDTQPVSKDSGVVDYKELPTENGTAVYTYKYKDTNGKEQTGETSIDVNETGNVSFVDYGDITNKKFASFIGPQKYQMTEEQAENVTENQSDYKEFQFVEYIQNNSDKVLAYKTIKVTDNGKNGVWMRTELDAEYTIAPGAVQPLYLYGIADMNKYDEDSLKEAFDSVKIELEYTLINSAQEDVDWESSEKMLMNIH